MEADAGDTSSLGSRSRTTSGFASISLDVSAWPRRQSQIDDASPPENHEQRRTRRQSPNWPFLRSSSFRSPAPPSQTSRLSRLSASTNEMTAPYSIRPRLDAGLFPGGRQGPTALGGGIDEGVESETPSPPPDDKAAGRRILHPNPNGPPSVYWSDDGATIASTNPSAFTFYREGSPTPDDDGEKSHKHKQAASKDRGGGAAGHTRSASSRNFTRPFNNSYGAGSDGAHRLQKNIPSVHVSSDRYNPPGQWSVRSDDSPLTAWSNKKEKSLPGPVSRMSMDEQETKRQHRRRRCFWIAAVLVAITIIAIGVGVGLGVGLVMANNSRKHSSTASSSTATGTASLPVSGMATATATTASTATPTASSESSAKTAASLTDCPEANNTVYAVPGSDKKFLRLCGVDFSGAGGAVDLSQVPTTSAQDCMNNCAGTSGCTGCGWGPLSDSDNSSSAYQCYLKSTLSSSHSASGDWCFGVLQ